MPNFFVQLGSSFKSKSKGLDQRRTLKCFFNYISKQIIGPKLFQVKTKIWPKKNFQWAKSIGSKIIKVLFGPKKFGVQEYLGSRHLHDTLQTPSRHHPDMLWATSKMPFRHPPYILKTHCLSLPISIGFYEQTFCVLQDFPSEKIVGHIAQKGI